VCLIKSKKRGRQTESKREPLVSIIILNWNGIRHLGKRMLKECLGSVLCQAYRNYEVIFVDNGSTDGSAEFVGRNFPKVKIMELDKNYGVAEGNDRGLRIAKGEYIVFLNNDTKVSPDWLSGLVEVANSSDDVGICGSKLLGQVPGRAVGEGRMNLLVMCDVTSRHATTTECFCVGGSSMLVKREVLDRLGQCFDPEFFAYFEEVDLCWRAKLAGYKVMYVPASEVVHKGGATSNPRAGQRSSMEFYHLMKFNHFRNKIWTVRKNTRFPLTQLLMVPVAATTLLQIMRMMLSRDWEYGITVMKYMFSEKRKSAGIEKIPLKKQLSVLLH